MLTFSGEQKLHTTSKPSGTQENTPAAFSKGQSLPNKIFQVEDIPKDFTGIGQICIYLSS